MTTLIEVVQDELNNQTADRSSTPVTNFLIDIMSPQVSAQSIEDNINRLQREGYTIGRQLMHPNGEVHTIIGYNRSQGGFYPALHSPLELRRESDNYTDYYSDVYMELI